MSALARWFKLEGYIVFGYDKIPTPLTRELEGMGIPIHYNDGNKRRLFSLFHVRIEKRQVLKPGSQPVAAGFAPQAAKVRYLATHLFNIVLANPPLRLLYELDNQPDFLTHGFRLNGLQRMW